MIAPVRSLGHYAYRWRGRIVLAALLVAVAAAIGSASVFDAVKPYGFQDPDSESARATEALEDASGERPLPDVVLIVEPSGGGPAKVRAAAAEAERRLADIPSVTRTAIEGLSEDKRAGLVVGYLDADVDDIADVGAKVEETFGGVRFVTAGGAAVTAHQLNETTEDDLRRIELYAAPLLFLLSLLVFRGLVAAALPLVVGVLSIVTTLLLLRLLTNVMEIDVFVVNIVIGLGLGLAIDYSLFVISRFRDELAAGGPTGAALRGTLGSTGRMILFSGLTVGVAMASLAVFPQRFLYSIGVGGALVALTSVLVSLTVLPAMLAMLGPRVNALAPRRLQSPPSEQRWYSPRALRAAPPDPDRDAGNGGDGADQPALPAGGADARRPERVAGGQQRPPGRRDPRRALRRRSGLGDRHRAYRAWLEGTAEAGATRAGADRGGRTRAGARAGRR